MRERGEAKETFWLREYRAKASSGDALVASGRGARFGTAQYLQTVAHVVSTLRPAVTDRVLDVGCGNGLMAIVLARLCGEMIGLEPVVELAAQARDHNRAAANVGIVAGEARALPVRTESVDIVLCYGVLQLIEDADDVERMLAELARVLRCPGRALVGGIPDLRAKARVLEPYLAEVQAAAHLSAADKAAILERNRRGRWYDPDDLATAARGAGFAAVWRPAPAALVESEDRFDLLLERGAAR